MRARNFVLVAAVICVHSFAQQLAVTFHGTLKRVSGKEVVILSEEQQEINIHITRRTKFLKKGRAIKPDQIAAGASVTVDVMKAPDLSLMATSVSVDEKKPAAP